MKWGIKKINIRLCLSEAADPPSSEFFCDLQSRSTGPGSNNTSQEQLQLSRDLRGLFCLPCYWQIFNPSFHEHFWNICCGPNGRQIRNWEFRNAKQSLSPQGGYIFQGRRIQIASIAIYVWKRSVKIMPGRLRERRSVVTKLSLEESFLEEEALKLGFESWDAQVEKRRPGVGEGKSDCIVTARSVGCSLGVCPRAEEWQLGCRTVGKGWSSFFVWKQ